MSYKEIAGRSPYFDDFVKELNFLRIMFKPDRSVQGRELTQLQTILQDQLSSLAGHFFKNNSVILGAEVSLNRDKPAAIVHDFVVLDRETGELSTTPLTAGTPLDTLVGKQFVDVDPQIPGAPDPSKTLTITHVIQSDPGLNEFKIYYTFSGAVPSQDDVFFDRDTGNIVFRLKSDYYKAVATKCDSGIVYRNGHFITVIEQEAIAGDDRSGRYAVGYRFDESVVTEDTEGVGDRLRDPAQGFYNYTAPGAHRYRIVPVLDSYNIDQQNLVDETFLQTFVPYLRVEDGVITYDKRDPDYGRILDLLARRTYDQAGDFTVNPFSLSVVDAPADDPSKITYSISPGLAYVRGYEVKKIVSTDIEVDRARDFETLESTLAPAGKAFYFVVRDDVDGKVGIQGYFDMSEKPEMQAYSRSTTFSAADAGLVGTVRGEALVRVGSELRLYVSEMSSKVRNNLKQIRSFRFFGAAGVGGIDVAAVEDDSILSAGVTEVNQNRTSGTRSNFLRSVYRGDQIPFVYPINDVLFARNVFGGDSSCELISVREADFEVVGSSLQATIVASSANIRFIADAGAVLFESSLFDGSNIPDNEDIDVTVDAVASPQSITVTITGDSFTEANAFLGSNPAASRTAKLYIRERLVQAQPRQKTLTTHVSTDSFNLADTQFDNVITFRTARQDGYRLLSVRLTSNVPGSYELTEEELARCTFDNGQKDTFYDDIIVTIPRSVINDQIVSMTGVTTIEVEFEYFEHSQAANQHYFSKASYPFGQNELELIPSYLSPNGQSFSLVNCIDFRQKKGEESANRRLLLPETSFETAAETFLPRRDLIVASYDGSITSVRGIPSREPETPEVPSGTLMTHLISLNPYTKDRRDLSTKRIDNQRYTMKQIGQLDKRIENLEKLTSLTLLEQKADTLKIIDSTTGFDKFKSGIFADPVRNHNLGSVEDDEYRIAATPSTGGGRCPQKFGSVELTLDEPDNWSTSYFTNIGIRSWKNTITMDPVGEVVLGENLTASGSVNVNPYLFYTWNGQVDLVPAVDTWFDTEYLPDINNTEVNVITNDGFQSFGNAPQAIWVGTSTTRNPDGSTSVTTTSESETIDDRQVDTSVIPFMRSIRVRFDAEGMRQGTLLRGFLDGFEVTLIPDSGYSVVDVEGRTRVQVNADGRAEGWFEIPADTVPTGDRPFLLMDSENTTSARTQFTSRGILETRQRSITTVRNVEVRTIPPVEEPPPIPDEEVERGFRFSDLLFAGAENWADPIAQSILVTTEGGAFLSSIDLYFKSAPTAQSSTEDKSSICVYMVEMENGLPTQNIIPMSKVTKRWQDINANAEFPQLGKNTFTFHDPIYLEEGQEYAFVVFTSSREYECWISTLGELDVFGGLPNGVNPNDEGLTDNEREQLLNQLQNRGGQSTSPSGSSNAFPNPISTQTGAVNGLPGLGIAEQPYLGSLFKSQNSSTWTPYQQSTLTFTLRQYEFSANNQAEAYFVDDKYDVNGKPGVTTAVALRKHQPNADPIKLSDMILNVGTLSPAGTSISFARRFFEGEPIGGLELRPTTNRERTYLGNEFEIDDDNSVVIRAQMSTQNPFITPVLDRFQNRVIGFENLVIGIGDPDIEGNFDRYDAGTYLSRNVQLANPADDLKVILDAQRPGLGDVEVSYRTQQTVRQFFTPLVVGAPEVGSTGNASRALEGEVVTLYGWTSDSGGRLVLLRGGRRITADPDGQTTSLIVTGIREAIDDPVAGIQDPRVYIRSQSTFYDGNPAANPSTTPFTPNPFEQLDGTVEYARKLLINDEEEIIEDFAQLQAGAGAAPYVDCPLWTDSLTTSEVEIDKIVLYNERLWRRSRITIANPEPVEGGEDWVIIPSISIASAIEDDVSGGSWRPMRLERQPAPGVDVQTRFAEYEYVPETLIESDFESFQIRVVLKSRNRHQMPVFKNVRAIAAI